jgi:hypothetical protein
MHQRHAEMLERTAITENLHAATVTLDRFERFWTGVSGEEATAV